MDEGARAYQESTWDRLRIATMCSSLCSASAKHEENQGNAIATTQGCEILKEL